jgi:hypothetical protein
MPPKLFTREADVKAEIKKLLTKRGWFYWMPAANGYGITGVADFLALRKGEFIAIEAKFGSNKPTVMQEKFLASVKAHGGRAMVVSEKNLATLDHDLM